MKQVRSQIRLVAFDKIRQPSELSKHFSFGVRVGTIARNFPGFNRSRISLAHQRTSTINDAVDRRTNDN